VLCDDLDVRGGTAACQRVWLPEAKEERTHFTRDLGVDDREER
jgi:hypothetical protein